MNNLRFAIGIALSVFWSTASSATVTVYLSEAQFDAATPITKYSIATNGQASQRSYLQNDVSFAADTTSNLFKLLGSGSFGSLYNNKNFLSFQAVYSITSGTITSTSKALGLTLGSYGQASNVTFSGTGFLQTFAIPSNPSTTFFGVISDAPIGTISFSSPDYIVDVITFSTASVAVVPEPATWAMLLIGFGAVGSTIRSRRRALATSA